MPSFSIPVPQFIRRKINNGRAKLDACTPLVLLRRRLAEADIGCSPPSSDDRLSLPMLLERHGRWSTALMCGAVEEVAMGLLVYQNGPIPICEQSLPKARIAAQKVVLAACNLLLSTSTDLVDHGFDIFLCVKENSAVLTEASVTMHHLLPGLAAVQSLDAAASSKEKMNATVRSFLDQSVNDRLHRAHACIFDTAEDLLRWHRLLRAPQPLDQDHPGLRAALLAMPGCAKLAAQRTWTAASVWALCAALSHASAANMFLTILMGLDDCASEDDSVEDDEQAKGSDSAPAIRPKLPQATSVGGLRPKQDVDSEGWVTNNAMKRRAIPPPFVTSQGTKYRIKTRKDLWAQDDGPSSKRHRVDSKPWLHGKHSGGKAEALVLGNEIRPSAENLGERTRVIGKRKRVDECSWDPDAVNAPEDMASSNLEEAVVPATQPAQEHDDADSQKTLPTREIDVEDAKETPVPDPQAVNGGDKKNSLGRSAAEAVGCSSWRLMSRAAEILPDAVVAAGSSAIVEESSVLGLDETLGLQTYYKWEEGPAVIGPWASRGQWTLVADNCPPPRSTMVDGSVYMLREPTGSLGDISPLNEIDGEGNVLWSGEGEVMEGEGTASDAFAVVPPESKPTVVRPETTCDRLKVDVPCTDASVSKEVSGATRRPTSTNEFPSTERLPLNRFPRPRLSWFALQAGLQSVSDVVKTPRGRASDLWQDVGPEPTEAGSEKVGACSLEAHEQDKPESAQEGEEHAAQTQEAISDCMKPNAVGEGASSDTDDVSPDTPSNKQAGEGLIVKGKQEGPGVAAVSNSVEEVGGPEMRRDGSNSSDATLVDAGTSVNKEGQVDGGLMSWVLATRIVDLGELLVGTSKASNVQANETRPSVSEDDVNTSLLSEDGYMAESESFDDSMDHDKPGGLADSESFGEFVQGAA